MIPFHPKYWVKFIDRRVILLNGFPVTQVLTRVNTGVLRTDHLAVYVKDKRRK